MFVMRFKSPPLTIPGHGEFGTAVDPGNTAALTWTAPHAKSTSPVSLQRGEENLGPRSLLRADMAVDATRDPLRFRSLGDTHQCMSTHEAWTRPAHVSPPFRPLRYQQGRPFPIPVPGLKACCREQVENQRTVAIYPSSRVAVCFG